MGISVEFNPDLALRAFNTKDRELEECLPNIIDYGKIYSFLKRGQRNYWLEGEIPLLRTEGDSKLSRPLASIKILEVTHFTRNGEIWTKGKYRVFDVFNESNPEIYFESYAKLKVRGLN